MYVVSFFLFWKVDVGLPFCNHMWRPILFVCPRSLRFWVFCACTFTSTGNGGILTVSTTSAILVTIFFAVAFAAQFIRQFAEDSHCPWGLEFWYAVFGLFLFFGSGGFSVLHRISRVESMVELVACYRGHYRSTRRILPLVSGRVGGLFWSLRWLYLSFFGNR